MGVKEGVKREVKMGVKGGIKKLLPTILLLLLAPRLAAQTGQQTRTFVVGDCKFDMVYVQGGSFMMGCETPTGSSPSGIVSSQGSTPVAGSGVKFHSLGKYDEFPSHAVRLDGYYLGRYEVTQRLWVAVMGYNPSNFKGDDLPVEQVSYFEVKEFLRRLDSLTGCRFRLPTEAEWEYAARGGRKSGGHIYAGGADATKVGWGQVNSGDSTHVVGGLVPNELGLYDMTGNVWEWCNDWYRDIEYSWQVGRALEMPDYIKTENALMTWLMNTGRLNYLPGVKDAIVLMRDVEFEEEVYNPQGADTGECRVGRGGSWTDVEGDLRIAYRNLWVPDMKLSVLGFRLALDANKKSNEATGSVWMPNQYIIDSIVGDKIYSSTTTQTVAHMAQGVLEGLFSVAPEKQVRFSSGNLQYNAVAGLWRFADRQYDRIGDANLRYGKSYAGWIDLFAWGTSGYREKYPYYFSANAAYYGNGANRNIDGTSYDWGVYNRIANGGDREGMWRTLSVYEWDYLMTRRPDAWLLRTMGQVGDVQGLVLLPDDWLKRGFDTLHYNTIYVFTPAQWQVMERAGAVFLPAAGECHFSNYTAALANATNPFKYSGSIEGFNVGYGTQIPMVHESVSSMTKTSNCTTDFSAGHGPDDIVTVAESDFISKANYAPPIEGKEQIGYYWTTIHEGKQHAMGMCFAIGRSAVLMPLERLVRCSVRLVQDVED